MKSLPRELRFTPEVSWSLEPTRDSLSLPLRGTLASTRSEPVAARDEAQFG